MSIRPVALLVLVALLTACGSISIQGQVVQPVEATGTEPTTSLAATTASGPNLAATVERAVRLTVTAFAPSETSPIPAPASDTATATMPPLASSPTATPEATDTASPTATWPPTPGPVRPAVTNLALNQSTRASSLVVQNPGSMAVDGDLSTSWGAGANAPQWIEINLGSPATITRIRMLVTQWPYGDTVHRILVGSALGELSEVFRFEQYSNTGLWLTFTPRESLPDVQFVRIETLNSPSWVGWLEIEVLGER